MSRPTPIGATRAARLLVGLRLRRIFNQLASQFTRLPRKAGSKQRSASPGKTRLGWLMGGLIGIAMVFGSFNLAYQAVSNMKTALGTTAAAKPRVEMSRPAALAKSKQVGRLALPAAAGHALPAGVLQAAALEVLILLIAVLLMSGGRELASPNWDIEWLVTLPMRLSTLLAVRIAERTVLSMGLLMLWPFLSVVAWESGYGIGAVPLAFGATLPLLLITATIRTLFDTGLRLSMSPPKLRNLQAVLSIAGVLLLYLAMSPGISTSSYVIDWAPSFPAWAFWLPPSLATSAVSGSEPASIGLTLLSLALQAGLCAAIGLAVLVRQLRFGVVAAGGRESGGRGVAKRVPAASAAYAERRTLLSPVQTRELRLLARDRNFLVQTLVLPVVIVVAQLWLNSGGSFFASASQNPEHLAAIAFGVAAYALMFSAFQTLNTEGHALWILYSVPHPIESILRQKAVLWGIACLVYPAAIFGFAFVWGGAPPLQLLGLAVIVFLGVPIFAAIATSLGVFASDPLAQEVQRRVRVSYLYLFMLLASLYVYCIYASSIWQRAGLMILTALLAIALWQKARDHLPYLLDPAASPPARVSVSDGLIAALQFFVLQAVLTLALVLLGGQKMSGRVLLIAFSIAGAATFVVMRLAFWRLKSEGVPRTFGAGADRAVVWGAGGGAAAALAAFVYLQLAQHTFLFEEARETVLTGGEDMLWIVVLAVVAAPIFEEFIFRGLIFGGLRRTLGLPASVLASAAIFALVHPPAGVIPVFGLGIAAALVYERTRLLIGPIAVHAAYNAAVIGFHFLI